MGRFAGFVGPSYTSESPNVDAESCINLYAENAESPGAKAPVSYFKRPGLRSVLSNDTGPVRGEFVINDRAFAVFSVDPAAPQTFNFLELFYDDTALTWTAVGRGAVVNDDLPVTMCSNGIQLLIASGSNAYVLDLDTNVFTHVASYTTGDPFTGISQVAFVDGFFIATLSNTRTFALSDLEDATSWNPIDDETVSVYGDNVVGMIVDHEQLWLFGKKQTIVYGNVGDPNSPLGVQQGSFIEAGLAARFAVAQMDNSIFWLGADARGNGQVFRANGYVGQRVSTHAVEYAISQMPKISDAEAYSFQIKGHSFVVFYFPSAVPDPLRPGKALAGVGRTWVFDASTNLWHEEGFWDTNFARYTALRARCHMFAFGKHLVGDWQAGTIFEQDMSLFTDEDAAIRWERRGPYISAMQVGASYDYFGALLIDIECGVGADAPDTWDSATTYAEGDFITYSDEKQYLSLQSGNTNHLPDEVNSVWWTLSDDPGYDPVVSLQISNDAGKTWGNERTCSYGKKGEYNARAEFRQNGRSLKGRRVFKLFGSAPVPVRITDADLAVS